MEKKKKEDIQKEDTLKPITKVNSKLDKELQEWEVESTTSGGWGGEKPRIKKPAWSSPSPKGALLVITISLELVFPSQMVITTLQQRIDERISFI
jgi:hypothetical protein